MTPEQTSRLKRFYAGKAFEKARQGEPGQILEVYRRIHGILPESHVQSLREIRFRESQQQQENLLRQPSPSSQLH